MWKRMRQRLLSGLAILLLLVWLAGAAGIAVWLVDATGLEVRRKGALGLVLLIYLVPVGVVVAVDEFIVRPVRHGPPSPGRHKRGFMDRGRSQSRGGRK